METLRMTPEQVKALGKVMSLDDAKSLHGTRILFTYDVYERNYQVVQEVVIGELKAYDAKRGSYELLDIDGNSTYIRFDPAGNGAEGMMHCSDIDRYVYFTAVNEAPVLVAGPVAQAIHDMYFDGLSGGEQHLYRRIAPVIMNGVFVGGTPAHMHSSRLYAEKGCLIIEQITPQDINKKDYTYRERNGLYTVDGISHIYFRSDLDTEQSAECIDLDIHLEDDSSDKLKWSVTCWPISKYGRNTMLRRDAGEHPSKVYFSTSTSYELSFTYLIFLAIKQCVIGQVLDSNITIYKTASDAVRGNKEAMAAKKELDYRSIVFPKNLTVLG